MDAYCSCVRGYLCSDNLTDLGNRVPASRGAGNPKKLLDDRVRIKDSLGSPMPDAQREAAGNLDEPDFPLLARGFVKGKWRHGLRRFRHHGHESPHIFGVRRRVTKRIATDQIANFTFTTDNESGLEG